MNKPAGQRVYLWDLAENGRAERGNPEPLPRENRDRRTQLDGLTTLMSLYDYGPVEMELPGVCTLPNGRSTDCKTKAISSSITLVYAPLIARDPIKPADKMPAGSAVHLELDRVGGIRGVVTAQNSYGFQVEVAGDCKAILSTKLAHLATSVRGTGLDKSRVGAQPSTSKLEPNVKSCSFTDHTNTWRKGKIVHVSPMDALIKAPLVPPLATRLVFRGRRQFVAEVTRAYELGFAVKFCPPIPAKEFCAGIISDQ